MNTNLDINFIKEQIRTEGYILLESLISESDCEKYKSLLESDHLKYKDFYFTNKNQSSDGLANKSTEKVVFNMHNKNVAYYPLFTNPTVLSVLDATLKEGSYMNAEPYCLLNISARCPLPNSKGQQLHLDSNLPGGDYPIIMVVLWMLDDFNPENGGTRIIPKSHKYLGYPENGKKYEEEVIVSAPKGSVLIYNAALWHGGSDKTSEGTRWAVVLGYGRWFIKPSFDFMKNMPIDIYNQLSDLEKDILGYRATPPKDEFTRMRRRGDIFETPDSYQLPIQV